MTLQGDSDAGNDRLCADVFIGESAVDKKALPERDISRPFMMASDGQDATVVGKIVCDGTSDSGDRVCVVGKDASIKSAKAKDSAGAGKFDPLVLAGAGGKRWVNNAFSSAMNQKRKIIRAQEIKKDISEERQKIDLRKKGQINIAFQK